MVLTALQQTCDIQTKSTSNQQKVYDKNGNKTYDIQKDMGPLEEVFSIFRQFREKTSTRIGKLQSKIKKLIENSKGIII